MLSVEISLLSINLLLSYCESLSTKNCVRLRNKALADDTTLLYTVIDEMLR